MTMDRRTFLARAAFLASAMSVVVAARPRPAVGQQSWTPPIGIPDPGWGITTPVMRPLPSPWTSNTSGFYYVRQGGTNSGNGFPASPRGTIPNPIPAGAVVVMDNTTTFALPSSSITANGTSANPCFIVGNGQSTASPAQLTVSGADTDFNGSYLVFEYIKWMFTTAGSWFFGLNGNVDHFSMRHCEAQGTTSTPPHAAFQFQSYTGSRTRSNVIIYDCNIHDINNWTTTTSDLDAHAIKVDSAGTTSNIWILDNVFDRICGDSFQIGPQDPEYANCHHIYAGGNYSAHCRQSGGWAKGASDVVFSQNTSFATGVPGVGGPGHGMGLQSGTDRCWFLFNHIYGTTGQAGLNLLYNLNGTGEGTELYAIGNVIHDLDQSKGQGTYGIQTQSPVAIGVVNNTIVNVPYGVFWRSNSPTVTVWNNVIDNVTSAHLLFDNSTVPSGSSWRNNLFGLGAQNFRIQGFQGTTYTSLSSWESASGGRASGNVNAAPTYVDGSNASIANRNFALLAGSRGIDQGNTAVAAAYARFETLYGLNIRVDFNRTARPQGSGWDIGAFEFGAGGGVGPAAPSSLQLG
jgi:hypothetical protein